MARESKGQQVKTFKWPTPQPDQSTIEDVVKVYFKAEIGAFFIYLPDHIGAAVQDGVAGLDSSQAHGAFVKADTQQDVIEFYKEVLERYANLLRTEGAVKVIRYRFLAQHPGQDYFTDKFRFDHGANIGSGVALLLDYEILWRSGNRLYYGHYAEGSLMLQDRGPVPGEVSWDKNRLIEWTEEREAFFVGMASAMTRLIEQLKDFLGDDIAQNIAALATGEKTLRLIGPGA